MGANIQKGFLLSFVLETSFLTF